MSERMTALVRETLRLNHRYLVEIVEAFGLCPWAERTRTEQRLARAVLLQTTTQPEAAVQRISAWSEEQHVDVGLLIFPNLRLGRSEFERFSGAVGAAYSALAPLQSPKMALAAFHPAAEANFQSPERLVPFVRVTPDPTIQVVRIRALERVRSRESGGTQYIDPKEFTLDQLTTPEPPGLRARIARANWETLSAQLTEVQRVHEDIRRDHEQTRRRLEQAELAAETPPASEAGERE
jgi:hypothetical protein